MNERRRMPMKKGSFIRNLSIMLFAQLILLTVLFVSLVTNMRDTATAEMETAADNIRGKFLRSSRPEKSHNNPKMASTWGCGAFGLCCV